MIFEAFPSFVVIGHHFAMSFHSFPNSCHDFWSFFPASSLDLRMVSGDLPSLGAAQMMLAEGDSREPSERAKTVTCLIGLLSI